MTAKKVPRAFTALVQWQKEQIKIQQLRKDGQNRTIKH